MKVAVGVIYDSLQRVLITQRAAHLSSGGLWEFPGGKLEPQETPEAALIREIKEEVNLEILRSEFIHQIEVPRETDLLTLYVFLVHEFQGQPTCLESQTDMRWVPSDALHTYTFPPTNIRILSWIKERFSI